MQALIVVDVQQDFCAGGALPVPDGDAVVEPIKRLIAKHDLVLATRDWHPPDHHSFREQGGPWPPHCVQGSAGARLHPGLDQAQIDELVSVGYEREAAGYSGFEQSELERLLRERGVQQLRICGLALDYCVKETALDAARRGFDVTVELAATRAIDASPSGLEQVVAELRAAGVKVV